MVLAPFVWRPWAKPVLALLALTAAVSSHFTQQLGVVMDPGMLRNVLRTDWHEAGELLNLSLLLHTAVIWLPVLLLLSQVQLLPRSCGSGGGSRSTVAW